MRSLDVSSGILNGKKSMNSRDQIIEGVMRKKRTITCFDIKLCDSSLDQMQVKSNNIGIEK
jgi:hypothetical protein